jgi:hypothetical protein
VNDLKYWGLKINNTLSWKSHIETILPKLSSACFSMRSLKPFVSQQMLYAICYSNFHTIISYGLIFCGNSAYSNRGFRMKKKIISIMTGSKNRDSCRKLFGHLNILPLPSLYIFPILRFVMKNWGLFVTNNEIHEHDRRQVHILHLPPANLQKYQSGVFYMGIKLYNCLPHFIKKESNNVI